ncbi:MAG: hypothetical protein KAT15_19590, partial [Bacteroidales bacterium]|nr:hypothetical protein [Bacteroidales bacterium]
IGWNLARINEEKARELIRHYHEAGFGGVFITAAQGNAGDLPEAYVEQGKSFMRLGREGIVYLDSTFIRLYRASLEEADKLDMRVILYDDYHFPTGQVAGQFYQQFPEHMADRLDKVETNHRGAGTITLDVPEGTYLGAALLEMGSRDTRDVSEMFKGGRISCQVAEGNWKLMAFYLNHEAVLKIRNPGIMNYIEEEAVAKFLSISYDKFHEGFGEYFGTVIPMSFYDEPSLHWLDGKIWSATFNDLYRRRYGESPIKYYPALWYDIGDKTAAARNTLHGLRAEMYADAFVKQLHEWCAEHNLLLSGHMDQEEIANPVMINGDLMKVFEYQDVPGADDIFWWGRSNPGYKIVTSASYNYDKPVTWAETYAAYRACDRDTAYKVAMDQYAMGINMQTPSSHQLESALSVEELIEFNQYIGRLSYLLQGGRHVSDIAVLYPIASAQAYNVFGEGWEYAYTGGRIPPELDYQDVGEDLFRRLRIDFTYLHPEVLEERCYIGEGQLILDNEINKESYRVLVLPGGNTIHAATAKKVLEFFMQGGKVIATSRLPIYSAEFGKDEVVRKAMAEIFGISREALMMNSPDMDRPYLKNANPDGGRAFFIPVSNSALLGEVLDLCLPVRDVVFEEPEWIIGDWAEYKKGLKLDSPEWMDMQKPEYDGALTYTHKVKSGRNVYFFANSSENEVMTRVTIRGKKQLAIWDPHSGSTVGLPGKTSMVNGTEVTEFELSLPRIYSLFIVETD